MRFTRKSLKRILIIGLLFFLSCCALLFISNYTIGRYSKGKIYSDVHAIQKNKVGLLLGTSKYLKNGNINYYFKYRVQATVELYNSGKIDFVLVSGDNGNKHYDEPTDFKNELIRLGIPEEKIFLDYAGFRTLDSVVRAKEIFGQQQITIISQQFHNERAIYIASKHGVSAVGYNAKDLKGRSGIRTKVREYFARTKVFIDILFNVEPKFLGEPIVIE